MLACSVAYIADVLGQQNSTRLRMDREIISATLKCRISRRWLIRSLKYVGVNAASATH